MYIKNFFRHLSVVTRHRWAVLRNCARCGILWRGLVHDLSKFSPTEFFESVKYYRGYRSPIGACREDVGYSKAWLHHKGRNKHHIEYWQDDDCEEHPLMPYKYAVECVCDKLAATRIYAGKSYTDELPLDHWIRRGRIVRGNPKTLAFVERVMLDIKLLGSEAVMTKKYMTATYREVCLSDIEEEKPNK
nr:catalase [Clostridia bacterium]